MTLSSLSRYVNEGLHEVDDDDDWLRKLEKMTLLGLGILRVDDDEEEEEEVM